MKTPKVKKRVVSLKSRAARRGEEPPSKDLLVAKSKAPAVEESDYKPWLHNTQSGGVGKKKKTKQLTRQQKARQQKLFEKADVVVNKLERKVEDSKARSKRVQDRAKAWEELNQAMEAGKEAKSQKAASAVLGESTVVRDDGGEAVMDDVDIPGAGQAVASTSPDVSHAEPLTEEPASVTAEPEIEVDEVT